MQTRGEATDPVESEAVRTEVDSGALTLTELFVLADQLKVEIEEHTQRGQVAR